MEMSFKKMQDVLGDDLEQIVTKFTKGECSPFHCTTCTLTCGSHPIFLLFTLYSSSLSS